MTQEQKIRNIGMNVDYSHHIKEYPNYTEMIIQDRKFSHESSGNPWVIIIILFILVIAIIKNK